MPSTDVDVDHKIVAQHMPGLRFHLAVVRGDPESPLSVHTVAYVHDGKLDFETGPRGVRGEGEPDVIGMGPAERLCYEATGKVLTEQVRKFWERLLDDLAGLDVITEVLLT